MMSKFYKIPKKRIKEFTWIDDSPKSKSIIKPVKTGNGDYVISDNILNLPHVPQEFKDKLLNLKKRDNITSYTGSWWQKLKHLVKR